MKFKSWPLSVIHSSIKIQWLRLVFGIGFVKVLAIPVTLLVSVILARSLGPEQFGQYTFSISLLTIVAFPVSGGFSELITREVAACRQQNNHEKFQDLKRSSYFWVLIFTLLVFIIALAINTMEYQSLKGQKWEVFSIVIWTVPLIGLASLYMGLLRGENYPALAIIPGQLIQPLCLLLAVGIVLWFWESMDVYDMVKSHVASYIVVVCFFIYFTKKVKLNESIHYKAKLDLRYWLSGYVAFTLIHLISILNSQTGLVILGILGQDESIAELKIAERASQFVTLSLTIVNIVIAPHLVKAFKSNEQTELKKIVNLASTGAFVVGLPIALLLTIFGNWLISTLYGDLYSIAYVPMLILIAGQVINVFCGSVALLLSMAGHEKITLFYLTISFLIHLIFSCVFIPKLGANGAAIASTISLIFWNVSLSYICWRKLNIIPLAFFK